MVALRPATDSSGVAELFAMKPISSSGHDIESERGRPASNAGAHDDATSGAPARARQAAVAAPLLALATRSASIFMAMLARGARRKARLERS